MAARGDHERAAGGLSFHAVRPEAFNYVWDNGIEPELEIDSGGIVEFTVRDAPNWVVGAFLPDDIFTGGDA